MFLVKNRRKRIKTIKVHQHHANKVPKFIFAIEEYKRVSDIKKSEFSLVDLLK